MKKGVIIVGLLVVAIIAAAYFGGLGSKPEEVIPTQSEEVLPSVAVTTVGARDLVQSLSLHGRFMANSQVGLYPNRPGKIADVFVRVGDKVSKDDPIVQLDTRELKLQVRQAEAALQAAQSNLDRVKLGARPEEIEQLEAGVKQAQVSYNNAKLNYERSKTLFEQGVISAREWEGIEAQYQGANAQLVNAEKTLSLALSGATEEDIKATEASVAQAQVALELAELALEYATIKSPIDGHISRLTAETGAMAGSGLAIATVVDISTVKLQLQVTGKDVARISVGNRALVTVDALQNQTFEGRVATISPAAEDGSGLFSVTVEIPNGSGQLRPGMYGTTQIIVEQKDAVVAVPARAIITNAGRSELFVLEEDTVKLVSVETGISGEDYVEIRSGINSGDSVVVVGWDSLRDGMKVQVREGGDSH